MSLPNSPSSPFPTDTAVPKAVLRVRRASREQLDVHAIEHHEAHRVRRMSKELLDLATPSTTEALRCAQPRELLDLRRAGSAQVSSSPTRTDRRACLYPNQSIPASPAPYLLHHAVPPCTGLHPKGQTNASLCRRTEGGALA